MFHSPGISGFRVLKAFITWLFSQGFFRGEHSTVAGFKPSIRADPPGTNATWRCVSVLKDGFLFWVVFLLLLRIFKNIFWALLKSPFRDDFFSRILKQILVLVLLSWACEARGVQKELGNSGHVSLLRFITFDY